MNSNSEIHEVTSEYKAEIGKNVSLVFEENDGEEDYMEDVEDFVHWLLGKYLVEKRKNLLKNKL